MACAIYFQNDSDEFFSIQEKKRKKFHLHFVFLMIVFVQLGKRGREEGEQAGPSKRPARNEYRIEGVVRTRPTYDGFDKPKSFKGGDRFKFQTNYFQISAPNWTIHKYHTTFEVSSTANKKRRKSTNFEQNRKN